MSGLGIRRKTDFLCLAIAFFSISFLSLSPLHADLAVVVNNKADQDDLSLAMLRKLLFGDRQYWDSSQRVTLVMHASGARERELLLKRIYEMDELQFQQYWVAKVFRGDIVEGPKFVHSDSEALQLLRSIPGSIAFVDSKHIPSFEKVVGIRVVSVNGRRPGEKGYALR